MAGRRRNPGKRRKNPAGSGPIPPFPPFLFDPAGLANAFIGALFRGIEQPIQPVIPPEMFRKLLMLCHPDKHGGSETAAEVTRWLLEQRQK